jgi:glutamine amidotransferase
MAKVCILDYGGGNVKSVFNMFESIGVESVISNKESEIIEASHVVLPGVGSFGEVMEKINSNLPLSVLEEEVLSKNKPFLGVCVGMQVLGTFGNEFGNHRGLNWIPGSVNKMEVGNNSLPHVGWNTVEFTLKNKFTNGLMDNPDYYFVHSNCFKPDEESHSIGITNYGGEFTSVVQLGNIFGVQFHPEKSQVFGKKILQNFLSVR